MLRLANLFNNSVQKLAAPDPNLSHLLKQAILGSHEDWLIFLDLLEEQDMTARKHIESRYRHTGLLGLFDALYDMFPSIITSRDFIFHPKLLGTIRTMSPGGYKSDNAALPMKMNYPDFKISAGTSFKYLNLNHAFIAGKVRDNVSILLDDFDNIEEVSSGFDGVLKGFSADEVLDLCNKYFAIAEKDWAKIKSIFSFPQVKENISEDI